tara:strand:+ start:5315 stop:7108 length:1794 start_codon:yes stop_codon:yes gene_type:complete
MDGNLKNYIDGLEDDSWRKLSNTDVLHIYSRVSQRIQAEEGTSLDTQRDEGIKTAMREEKTPVLWNEGFASSSGDTFKERRVLEVMFNELLEGNIKHLYAWDYDRLARNEKVWYSLKYGIYDNKVTLHSRDGKVDFSSENDKLMFTLRQAFSIYENAQRAIRSKTGKMKRAQQGYYMNSVAPYGYEIVNKKLQLHKEKSKHAKKIMMWWSSGISTTVIREKLLKMGIPSANGNAIWAKGSLDSMISNTCYIGYTIYQGVRVSNPNLLSREEYKPVKDRINDIKIRRGLGRYNSKKYEFMLTDKIEGEDNSLLYCQDCGGEMSGKSKNFYDSKGEVTKTDLRYTCGDSSRRYRIRNTDGRKRLGGEIEDLGEPCKMKFSLDRDTTENYIFSIVNEVVRRSSLTRETFKQMILEEYSSKRGGDTKRKASLDRELKRFNKDIGIFQELITKSNMELGLKEISSNQHKKNVGDYNNQIHLLEDKVSKNIEELLILKDKNTYVDWFDIHKRNMKVRESLKGKQREEIIKDYVERVDVTFDRKNSLHILTIKFKYNIVRDNTFTHDETVEMGVKKIEGKNTTRLLIKKKERIKFRDLENANFN